MTNGTNCNVCEGRAAYCTACGRGIRPNDADRYRAALDFIASDATITPEGCPEPWRSTLIDWAQAAAFALDGGTR